MARKAIKSSLILISAAVTSFTVILILRYGYLPLGIRNRFVDVFSILASLTALTTLIVIIVITILKTKGLRMARSLVKGEHTRLYRLSLIIILLLIPVITAFGINYYLNFMMTREITSLSKEMDLIEGNVAETGPAVEDPYLKGLRALNEWETTTALRYFGIALGEAKTPEAKHPIYFALGQTYYNLGEFRKAKNEYSLAIKYARESGDNESAMRGYIGRGNVEKELGNFGEAKGNYLKAKTIAEDTGDRNGLATVLIRIGVILMMRGDPQTALGYFNRSLDLSRNTRNLKGEAEAHRGIGLAGRYIGDDLGKAKLDFEKAITIFQGFGARKNEADTWNELSLTLLWNGDWAGAEKANTNAYEIHALIKDKHGIANDLNTLGDIRRRQGRYEQSLEAYYEALRIYTSLGSPVGEGTALLGVGGVYLRKNEGTLALYNLEKALVIFESINLPAEIERTKKRISRANSLIQK